jgi:hypothetical protein
MGAFALACVGLQRAAADPAMQMNDFAGVGAWEDKCARGLDALAARAVLLHCRGGLHCIANLWMRGPNSEWTDAFNGSMTCAPRRCDGDWLKCRANTIQAVVDDMGTFPRQIAPLCIENP